MTVKLLLRDVIRERRQALGLSEDELAQATGIRSGEFIRMIERGHRGIHIDQAPIFAQALRLNAWEFCQLALFDQAPHTYRVFFGEADPVPPKIR
jgi:transcriptional regulator with XRE-family HTH domain